MSIVPYNTNHEIVYHDPNHGILVLHNNQKNSIQLLSTIDHNYGFNAPHFSPKLNQSSNTSNASSHQCPNCGFTWPKFESESTPQFRRRRSDTSTNNMSTALSLNQHSSVNSEQLSLGFMHSNYFKVLANLPYNDHQIGEQSNNDSLPEDIFNQGYFERFFKKITPFVLGSGAHAQVYKVMHVLNKLELGVYAIKRISIGDHSAFLDQVLYEVLILHQISTKGANENNLIRYNHVWLEMGDLEDLKTYFLPHVSSTKENKKNDDKVPYVFILQQYCDGGHLEDLIVNSCKLEDNMNLKDKLALERIKRRQKRTCSSNRNDDQNSKPKWLSDIEIWKLFKDVSNGVNYLHEHGILHRDLKPSNCLLDTRYAIDEYTHEGYFRSLEEFDNFISKFPKVLVSDFGEGKFIDKQYIVNKDLGEDDEERRGNTGTLEFTAPELWLYANYDPSVKPEKQRFVYGFTYKSDIYSLGLILCWLCVGSLPFSTYIVGENDPDKVKNSIATWYLNLSEKSFHVWFASYIKNTRSDLSFYTNPIQDFEKLIYLMLKGHADGSNDEFPDRVKSSEVMKYLEAMKWKRFIGNRRSSIDELNIDTLDTSITTTSNYDESLCKEEEEEDDDALDLTKARSDSKMTLNSKSTMAYSEKFDGSFKRPLSTFSSNSSEFAIAVYLINIIVLDFVQAHTIAKYLNLVSFAIGLLLQFPFKWKLVLLLFNTVIVLALAIKTLFIF